MANSAAPAIGRGPEAGVEHHRTGDA